MCLCLPVAALLEVVVGQEQVGRALFLGEVHAHLNEEQLPNSGHIECVMCMVTMYVCGNHARVV